MTDALEMAALAGSGVSGMCEMTSCAINPNIDQDIRARVQELLMLMYPPGPPVERRRDRRYPFPHLVHMTPVTAEGLAVAADTIVVVGKTLSENGFGFFHPHPLADRRMIASFHAGGNRWLGLLVDLRWCRFGGRGWYESGGRFLEAVPAAFPENEAVSN